MPESLFNEAADHRTETLLKRRLLHRYFSVNFAKFLKTPFLTEHLLWLLQKRVHLWRRVFRREAKLIIFRLISFIFYSLKCFFSILLYTVLPKNELILFCLSVRKVTSLFISFNLENIMKTSSFRETDWNSMSRKSKQVIMIAMQLVVNFTS